VPAAAANVPATAASSRCVSSGDSLEGERGLTGGVRRLVVELPAAFVADIRASADSNVQKLAL
jgi:hypothetical protein